MSRDAFLDVASVTLFALAMLTLPAKAHDDATWIMQGPHSYCCGPEDCHPIKVRVVPNGWAFDHPLTGKLMIVDFDYPSKPSEDHQFWACFNLIAEDKPLREGCFFLPAAQG